ncbi:MAG: YkgJ family cysteine cluster protein [Nitrospinae bacterium]|nr:YkgJ family cysteine cluster protein [Nitrospinota bacterium]
MAKAKPVSANPCETCPAVCCTYLSIIVEKPDSREHVEYLLWHILHGAVEVYLDTDGDWTVAFHNRCKHLKKDNRCAIYARRPSVCRTYSARGCHGGSFDESVKVHFRTPGEFMRYLKKQRPAGFRKLPPHLRRLASEA